MTGERTDPYPPTVEYVAGTVVLLDQTALPEAERYVRCEGWQRVAQAIVDLEVRGAPAIGITAAFGLALAAEGSQAGSADGLLAELGEVAEALVATRPTAVNLAWAVESVLGEARGAAGGRADDVRRAVVVCAQRLGQAPGPATAHAVHRDVYVNIHRSGVEEVRGRVVQAKDLVRGNERSASALRKELDNGSVNKKP